jgi:hypothetical protein
VKLAAVPLARYFIRAFTLEASRFATFANDGEDDAKQKADLRKELEVVKAERKKD